MTRRFISSLETSRWRFWSNRRSVASEAVEPLTFTPASHKLDIVCCGTFVACYAGQELTFTRSRKSRELLAFLATRPGMTASYDDMITALWPDTEPDRARRLLINAAWRIRCSLRDSGMTDVDEAMSLLRFDHGRYSLDTRFCTCDLALYGAGHARSENYFRPFGPAVDDAQHARDEAQRLLELDTLVESPVLAGEAYSWLPALERQLHDLRLTSLRRALALTSHTTADTLALTIAERILMLDALDEKTVALTLRLYLARGDTAAAATTYRSFRLALARRYGSAAPDLAQPSQQLQALFARAVGRDAASGEPAPSAHAPEAQTQAQGPPPRAHLQ